MELQLTLDTWIVSDTHFGHDNIIRYCDRPADHDRIQRENWLATIGDDDQVLHLGDIAMGRHHDELIEIVGHLPGRKYFIKGNHDRKKPAWFFQRMGFKLVQPFIWTEPRDGKRVLFIHDPAHAAERFDWDICIAGHIHTNGYPPQCAEDRDFRNISPELLDYKPVRLEDVLYNGAYRSRIDAGVFVPSPR